MVGIVSAGIGSGLDVGSLVQQLVTAEAAPTERRLATREAGVLAQISAFGTVKSALSDFRTTVETLKDADNLLGRKVTLEENEIFSARVDADVSPGEFDVEVVSQASAQKLSSSAYADSLATIGYGTLTLSSGDNTFSVDIAAGEDRLVDIRDTINSDPLNTSIRATIVATDAGTFLSLSALETGSAAEITVTSSGGDGGLTALEYDSATASGALTEVRAAQDATVVIDGQTVTSSSNTIADAIDGVTIELTGAEPGTLRNVRIDFDRAGLEERVNDFVEAYNALLEAFDDQTAFDAEAEIAGPLLGDSTLRGIRDQLRRSVGDALLDVDQPLRTLSDIGVSINVEGRAEIDQDRLDAALDDNFTSFGTLFTSDEGVATRLDSLLDSFLDSDSALEARTEGLETTIDDIATQREALQERLVSLEARLLDQFNALDRLVSQLTSTSNFLAQQLNQLPGIGRN